MSRIIIRTPSVWWGGLVWGFDCGSMHQWGLGGFFFPIIFGYLLDWTGMWSTCWMFLSVFCLGCFVWMHGVVRQMGRCVEGVVKV